jgi:hypothetical protein
MTIYLEQPVYPTEGPVKCVTIRAPRPADYAELGDPATVPHAAGAAFRENTTAIAEYLRRSVRDPRERAAMEYMGIGDKARIRAIVLLMTAVLYEPPNLVSLIRGLPTA